MLVRAASPAPPPRSVEAPAGTTRRLDTVVSWIGNDHPGAETWVKQGVKSIHVTPGGTVYAVTEWDEAGREVGSIATEKRSEWPATRKVSVAAFHDGTGRPI